MQTMLQLRHRPFHLAGAGTNRPRHPIEGTQAIQDRTFDAVDRVSLELETTLRFELVDRVNEAKHPVGDEIRLVDVARQSGGDSPGDELHQRRVLEDERLARVTVGVILEPLPQSGYGVGGIVMLWDG